MDHKFHFSTFSQIEEPFYERFQRMRDRFFAPVCVLLTKAGVKPDHLSYFNLLLLLPFAYFLHSSPFVSFGVLVASLLADALDGCLARHQQSSSQRGALLDIAADHTFFLGVVLSLIFVKTVDGFWGAAYAVNYLVLIFLVMLMRSLKMHVFPVFRSKYYFFFFWTVLLFTGLSYLDIFLVFCTVYMFLTNLFLFHSFRCSIS